MNKKVGIVITCYNKQNFVKTAISSVLAQVYSNIQLVVVDDASTDNSTDRITEMREMKDVDFDIVFKDKNEGTAFANNAGIAKFDSDVEYMMVFGGDDVMSERLIDKRVKKLESLDKNVSLIYENFYILHSYPRPRVEIIRLGFPFNRDKLIMSCFVNGCCLFKRDIFEEAGGKFGYEGYTKEAVNDKPAGYYGHAEDYDQWLRLTDKYEGYWYDLEPAFTWLYRKPSAAKSLDAEGTDYCRAKVQELAKKRRGLIS